MAYTRFLRFCPPAEKAFIYPAGGESAPGSSLCCVWPLDSHVTTTNHCPETKAFDSIFPLLSQSIFRQIYSTPPLKRLRFEH
ncbi:hypothetical protein L1987_33210 [Smallanthus sonchifolius]|uniref:Uncharacterized protein n=1 Tax=Smallanthus sonchifolius TaxID=185202 RepID=A0ACB9HS32_9ASTR|nr:hypothetical protein L1987_33210 [Smallanthus sonchifolius]